MDTKQELIKKIKDKPAVASALELASKYYIEDPTPIRKELKSMLVFLKKTEAKTKLDLGFDIAFRNPNTDMSKLGEIMARNEQYRARATELHINLKKMCNRLDFLYKNTSDHISVEYDGLISAMTKAAQSSLIDIILEDIINNRMVIVELLDDIRAVMSSMDSTHWTLKGIKEIGEGIIQRNFV